MPKLRKLKRKKTYKANINRKRLRNKLRKLPDIECDNIKEAWDDTKSTRTNLSAMGLAYDPNKVLKIPNSKRELLNKVVQDMVEDSSVNNVKSNDVAVPSKIHVAATLEAEAKAPRERRFRLPNQQVQFVTYLMDKYEDDYEAMARDKKNYYQMTARQIRAKINTYKSIPEQYADYLISKGQIILDDPTPLEETRKRIAEENVKKFCTPKPKKAKPAKVLDDSDEEWSIDTGCKVHDMSSEDKKETDGATGGPTKKLQLFSDDDDEDGDDDQDDAKSKSKLKKSRTKLEDAKNGKATKRSVEYDVQEMSSESEEELEGDDDDDEADFVDLNEASDEELSDDDIIDNSDFVSDIEEIN